MSFKKTWVWEAYFLLFIVFVVSKVYRFFSPSSPQYLYFSVLTAFHPLFILLYLPNLAQIILNVFHCIPLFLYIHRIKLGNPKFWKFFFILHLIFDFFGHSYEMKYLISLYYFDPKVLAFVFIQSVSTYIPSYIACFRYAFQQEKYLK